MQRKLEKRLDALEAVNNSNCPDIIILRWTVDPGEPEKAKTDREAMEPTVLRSGTRRWLREVQETVEQFKERALSEMPRPAKGPRVLFAEGFQ